VRWAYRSVGLELAAVLAEGGVRELLADDRARGQVEEARDRVARVDPTARPERVDAAAAQVPSRPKVGAAYRTTRPEPRLPSALPKLAFQLPETRWPPGLKTGTRVRSCTVPPSASLPYSALEGPRTTSIPSRASGSTMSKNVLMPPRWAEVV
jgi:hypothetical protein